MRNDKFKLLLVNPSTPRVDLPSNRAKQRYDPPLGALFLGSFLSNKNISLDIVDTAIEEINYDDIQYGEYNLISFTIFIGEFQKNARIISKNIKKINPDLPIVYGGVMPSIFPNEFLKNYPVDYIIRYEGENTLYELIQSINGTFQLNDINGLSYKSNNTIIHNPPRDLEKDLNTFPVPRWELLGSRCNIQQIPYYYAIMSSKGCPFKCSFCYNQQVEDKLIKKSPKWRFRSAQHVIDEIMSINKQTGTRVFSFEDDNFLVNLSRALEILNFFKLNHFYIEQCMGHMNNYLNDSLLESMSGVVQTARYSIESASPQLLKLLNKNLNIDQVPLINERLFDKGITTIHYFIVGLPTETERDLKRNVDLMKKLKEINPYVRGHSYLYLPLPNTPLEKYIRDDMGFNLPHSLEYFEKTHRLDDFEGGQIYRPWIDDQRYSLLRDYCSIFQELFQINNMSVSNETKSKLEKDPCLKWIFGDLNTINKPIIEYYPYVLDRILGGESVDLKNDLKKRVKEMKNV